MGIRHSAPPILTAELAKKYQYDCSDLAKNMLEIRMLRSNMASTILKPGEKMLTRPARIPLLLLIIGLGSQLANADLIPVGELTFDSDTPTALAAFDITNLTGVDAFPPDFPITTQLTITVTSLVASLQGGETLSLNGSDFSVVDAQGDVDCTVAGDAGAGGCDFSAYNVVSATISGTLSPTTGLAGLPVGDTGILGTFTTTILPNVGCGPSGGTSTTLTAGCDVAVINANAVPEPASRTLPTIALIALLAAYKIKRSTETT